MLRFRFVAVLLAAVAAALPAPAQQFDASATGGPTQVDAPWRLHFGDDAAFAQPGFDDSQWILHRIDKDWVSEGRNGYAGYAWYRMRVVLPWSNEPLAIAIYPPANAAEVYIDGALAGTIGRMRPEPEWTYQRAVYAIPIPAAPNGRTVEVALRVWNPWQSAQRAATGAATHPALIGRADDVARIVTMERERSWLAKMPDWTVDLAGLCVGLFSFGLFLLQRQAREDLRVSIDG